MAGSRAESSDPPPLRPEPLAIVGVGCRLPGGITSLAQLEACLAEARSGIVDVPPERWDAAGLYHPDFRKRGHLQATRGGFLDGVDLFDPGFFGIAPKEALAMDPQQRLVLETSYQALEDAGLRLDELAGTRTAVFVGSGSHDYGTIQTERARIGPTSNTGSAASIIANRVSFLFDLKGPSMTVDTACSSALAALHLACSALQDGSAEMALAGGVNLILRPESSIGFSKGGYLSPDGECRAFSDDANGYVRSEGAAMALLMPLARARREGRRVHGVILATAVNQDGRTPGMTMPSRAAQETMLREAYRQAGVRPDEVVYVEAHGTGTPIGDPIEAGAIGAVLGAPRTGPDPLWLGSVKTNLGHLETAAGMAGLLKLILVLGRRRLYPNRSFRAPNPEIPFAALKLAVPTRVASLPAEGRLVGGLNSFGFGGTNGHLVLASPPADEASVEEAADAERGPWLLRLSARSEPALRELAGALADELEAARTPLAALCGALARQRSAFGHRLALVGDGRQELSGALRSWAGGAASAALRTARVPDGEAPAGVVFVFSGQGPQWWAMGRELLQREPEVRAAVEEIDRELAALGWLADEGSGLLAELLRDEASSRIGETRVAQPALFALQVGLSRWFLARGVTPVAVVGHSLGELAAAVTAGALSLREATRLVLWRSRAQSLAEGKGLMAALGLPAAAARERLVRYGGALELAADNGPQAVTVAGERAAVEALGEELAGEGVFFRVLDVSVPFHCQLMDPVEAPFRAGVGAVATGGGGVAFVSTVAARTLEPGELDLDYWWRNIRAPVRFLEAVEGLIAAGETRFLELSPQPILRRGLREALERAGARGEVIPTLLRGEPESRALTEALGRLWLADVPCRPLPELPARFVPGLPAYPFQRRSYWQETPQAAELRRRGLAHPTVGWPRPSSAHRRRFSAPLTVDPEAETYLLDHHVQGLIVLPGAGQLEACHSAGTLAWGEELFLEDVVLRLPMSLPPDDDPPEFVFEVTSDEGHFQIASRRPGEREAWSIHTRGRLNAIDPFPAVPVDLAAVRARVATPFDHVRFYAGMAETGLELGPAFQGIVELYVSEATGEVLSKVFPPAALEQELGRYAFHPALLDAVFQGSSLGSFRQARQGLFLPHRVRRMKFFRRPEPGRELWSYARLARTGPGEVELDVTALDAEGRPLVELQGFVLKLVSGSSAARESLEERPWYEPRWEPFTLGAEPRALPPGQGWLLLTPPGSLGQALAEGLRAEGAGRVVLLPGEGPPRPLGDDVWEGDPTRPEAVLDALGPEWRCHGLVHLLTLDPRAWTPEAALSWGPAALTAWAAALTRRGAWARGEARPAVWAVTAGAWPEAGAAGEGGPWGAALWGAARVLRHEDPRLQTTLVDLSGPNPPAAERASLAALLREPAPPTEVRLRGEARELGRLYAARLDPPKRIRVPPRSYRAGMRTVGVLDSAGLIEARRRPPGPGEIEVAVRAAALNFKDVVVGMGLIDRGMWRGVAGAELGMDLAGTVTAVGEGVREFAPGDEVLGLAAGSMSSHVVLKAVHAIPRDPRLSPELACSLPTVFLTADVALNHLARLAPGETVLIHAGAGGVGTAAIQVAHEVGARVIATTSSEAKRAWLAELGVETVFDSRKPTFREGVLAATGGRGVDVVLNSLSGDALSQGIRCLAAFGRFVEIGKLDLAQNRQIGLEPFANSLSYFSIDVNHWVSEFPAEGNRRMRVLAGKVADGSYRMPVQAYPVTEVAAALRQLAQARHVGKIVVSLPAEAELEVDPGERELFRADGTYLVSGGCAGFGLEVAAWIAAQGGGALLLLNRRGVPGPAEAARVEALRAAGARVLAPPCDVSDPAALERVLAEARRELPPLRGVFHAAMVLDDAPLGEQTPERFARVGAPKVAGGWHLDRLTRDDPLEHFVLFSSVAAVLGTPGHANYAAANAWLDGLARARRAAGRPALALQLGPLDGVGVLTRETPERRARILGQGLRACDGRRALELLAEALRVEPVERVAALIDWEKLPLPPEGREGRFTALRAGQVRPSEGRSLLDELRAVPPAQRPARVVAWTAEFLARISGQDLGEIDPGASLTRLGIDSLMANQLLLWLQTSFQVEVPLVRLMQGPTVQQLAEEVARAALPAG